MLQGSDIKALLSLLLLLRMADVWVGGERRYRIVSTFVFIPESASEGFPFRASPGAREAPFHLQGRSQELHATRPSSLQAPECCKIRHASFGKRWYARISSVPGPAGSLGRVWEGAGTL